jgi:hypothetical protein
MTRLALRLAFAVSFSVASALPVRGFQHTAVASAQSTAQRQFSREEREKLAKEELVVRRIAQRRGPFNLVGGNSWQVIAAPPEMVWRALLDTYYYRRTLPAVLEANLVKDTGNQRVVFLRQGSRFIQITDYLRLSIRADRKEMDFCIDERLPHSIKAGWDFFAVRTYGKAKTVLAYGVMVDVGDNLVAELMRGTTREWMLKVPSLVKRFVEGRGRWLYR